MGTPPRTSPAQKAYSLVCRAVKDGILFRPDTCELCQAKHNKLSGHHWRGYDYPYEVWWICERCNSFLRNKHDGSLTKYEAIIYIRDRKRQNGEPDQDVKLVRRCQAFTNFGERCQAFITSKDERDVFCRVHQLDHDDLERMVVAPIKIKRKFIIQASQKAESANKNISEVVNCLLADYIKST